MAFVIIILYISNSSEISLGALYQSEALEVIITLTRIIVEVAEDMSRTVAPTFIISEAVIVVEAAPEDSTIIMVMSVLLHLVATQRETTETGLEMSGLDETELVLHQTDPCRMLG